MINRSQLGRTTMVNKFKDKLEKSRIDRASRSNPAKGKKSRKLPQKPSYLSTPKQQLRKALSKARRTNTSKEGLMIDPARFLSKAENQRSRLGLGEAKNVGKQSLKNLFLLRTNYVYGFKREKLVRGIKKANW